MGILKETALHMMHLNRSPIFLLLIFSREIEKLPQMTLLVSKLFFTLTLNCNFFNFLVSKCLSYRFSLSFLCDNLIGVPGENKGISVRLEVFFGVSLDPGSSPALL